MANLNPVVLSGNAPRQERPGPPAEFTADETDASLQTRFLSGVVDVRRLTWFGVPLIAVLVALLLWLTASALTFQDDAAQYLSTASHLLAGDGLRTSVLYYDSQLIQQAPAIQTVWPAGLPVATAAVAWLTGLSLAASLLLVVIAAHLGTALLLMLVIRLTGLGRWLSLSCGLFWLLFVPSWLSVSRGLSDPVYQLLGMASVVAIACYFKPWSPREQPGRGGREMRWLWVASLAVMLAILVRYQAVSLIVPLFVAMTIGRFPADSNLRRVCAGTLAAVAPLSLTLLLFLRNYWVTGSLTGGAVSERGQTLTEIASRIGWVPDWMQMLVLYGLILSAFASALVSALLWLRDGGHRSEPQHLHPAVRAVSVYCLGAYAGNIALLLYLCLTSTAYVFAMRYMGMCLLFLIPPVIVLAAHWARNHSSSLLYYETAAVSGQWVPATGLALLAVSQLWILQPTYLARLESAPPTLLNQTLLSHSVNGQSVRSLLGGQPGGHSPVLMSTHAHALNLLTGGTVIGVPVPIYTTKRWREPQIRALALRHNVTYLVAFRELDTWVYRDLINRMLDENQCPSWVEPLVANRRLFIGRVRADDAVRSPMAGPGCGLPATRVKPTVRSGNASGATTS